LIKTSKEAGADLLCGGERKRRYVTSCVLEKRANDPKIKADEALGQWSIIGLLFSDFDAALKEVITVSFFLVLQAGIFTTAISSKAIKAW